MYISQEQIRFSLLKLHTVHPFFGMSFLVFKKEELPIGSTVNLNFTQVAKNILEKYYRASLNYKGYYSPFHTSDPENRWVKPRYPSTSLQRITKDTFKDALLHPTPRSWGWKSNYVKILRNFLGRERLPAFDLAVWLFRSQPLPAGFSSSDLIEMLYSEFNISVEERELFDKTVELPIFDWLADKPISERELFDIIGPPPDAAPEEGAALRYIELRAVGPSAQFSYEPAERLNIITGDNSSGKTFLLECIWWALTGEWLDNAVTPRRDVAKTMPRISYSVGAINGRPQEFISSYNWDTQEWSLPRKRNTLAGLVVYARYDGSFAVWDPARVPSTSSVESRQSKQGIFFHREDIWFGLQAYSRKEWICNGLLRDWVTWQTSGRRYEDRWSALVASLRRLSPSEETLETGEPVKLLATGDLEIPTIHLPYGEVPILHASAGIQRAVALAYILVWTWFRHIENSKLIRREPQRRIVLIIDEAEAHLHPRWQRAIVPSLMDAVSEIAPLVSPQIHLATHSPMIMASVEAVFNHEVDELHHLKLEGKNVTLEELPFVKRGRIDLWLMSDVFGLAHARSSQGEEAIEAAKHLQLQEEASEQQVQQVNDRLMRHLAQDDDFWPRWRYFAREFGVQ